MDHNALLEFLGPLLDRPLLLAMAVGAFTFVLEDAALLAGAFLSAAGYVPPLGMFAALYLGIVIGDVGLYGMGRAARTQAWLFRALPPDRVEMARGWLDRRLWLSVIGARFVPGLRVALYSAIGFLRLPLRLFAAAAAVAAMIWTVPMFLLLYTLGEAEEMLGPWRWLIGIGIVLAIGIVPRLIDRARKPRRLTEAPGADQ